MLHDPGATLFVRVSSRKFNLIHEGDREKFLKELVGIDFFQGEVALENDLIAKYLKEITSLNLSDVGLALAYAELRGKITAMQELQNIRKRITDAAPQR